MAGLYAKYKVTKVSTGEDIRDCFVLRPDRDEHARAALRAYAESIREENEELAMHLATWMDEIEIEQTANVEDWSEE
jgi:hypothetical protein